MTLSQAQAAVTSAQNQLDADTAASAPQATLDKDTAALQQAQANLASTQLKVNQSNQQAAQQVTNASLSYQAAKLQYQSKIAPASSATVQADQAKVASAQATVDAAQAAVTGASIMAPADGLIIAVNILPGVNAPSDLRHRGVGRADGRDGQLRRGRHHQALKVGQSATVSVTAARCLGPRRR